MRDRKNKYKTYVEEEILPAETTLTMTGREFWNMIDKDYYVNPFDLVNERSQEGT